MINIGSICKESGFWFGAALLLSAALLVVCCFGGLVGFLVGVKWGMKDGCSKTDEDQKYVFICSTSKPSCFHLQSVCGGVAMKPLRMCEHCSKKEKKWM